MSQIPPPIDADAFPPEPPKWPKVVGIFSICWGILGCLCGGCGLLQPLMMNMMPPEQRTQFPPEMISSAQMVGIVAGMLFNFVLIAAGSTVVARKPVGRVLHLIYAALAIAGFVVGIYFQMQQQAVMEQWARENPDSQFAKQMKAGGNIGMLIGWVIGGILGLAYPAFCIVWFGLVKRTPDSMGTPVVEEVL